MASNLTVRAEVRIQTKHSTMLLTRLEELAKLKERMKADKAAADRKVKEITEILGKAGVSDEALDEGVEYEGYKFTRVGGTTKSTDEKAIMSTYDLSPEEFEAAFVTRKPKKKYIKITAPGEKDDE